MSTTSQLTVLRADRHVAASGDVIAESSVIIVEGDRITAAGPARDHDVPEGATVLDFGDATLMPGMIDAHMHFYGVPADALYMVNSEWEAYRAIRAAGEARRMLEAGVTAARCLGSSVSPALRRAIEDGWVRGPRLVSAGEFITSTGGTYDPNAIPIPIRWAQEQGILANGVEAVREAVRYRLRQGSTVIKVGLSKGHHGDVMAVWGDDSEHQVTTFTPPEVSALTDEAHRYGLKVSAHCIGDGAVRLALDCGVDVIEHGFGISEETRKRVVDRGILIVTTFYAMSSLLELDPPRHPAELLEIFQRHRDDQRADFERGLRAGVRYALGTDSIGEPISPHEKMSREFQLAVEFGMTPSEALRAGTAVAAEALGWQDRIGALDAGMLADVLVVDGDPGRDIRALERVRFVMQGGSTVVDHRATR